MGALACFGGESTQRPTVKIVLVNPTPRVASRHRLDISRLSRSNHCSPLLRVTAHKSGSRRVGDERFGSTSFDRAAAARTSATKARRLFDERAAHSGRGG